MDINLCTTMFLLLQALCNSRIMCLRVWHSQGVGSGGWCTLGKDQTLTFLYTYLNQNAWYPFYILGTKSSPQNLLQVGQREVQSCVLFSWISATERFLPFKCYWVWLNFRYSFTKTMNFHYTQKIMLPIKYTTGLKEESSPFGWNLSHMAHYV